MGEELPLFRMEFNGSVRLEARGERLTSDAGAVLLREALERLGIAKWLAERLVDMRKPELITHPLDELLKTALLLLGQGYRDADDADVMRDDAVFRLAVSNRKGVSALESRPEEERRRNHNPVVPDGLPSQPTLSRTVAMLGTEENRAVLRKGLLETAGRRYRASRGGHRQRHLTIDVDSLPVEVHGHQPGSAHNGHYHARIYHPLVASCAETGDMLDVQLREGNVHTAEGALDFVLPLVDEVERQMCQVAAVRIDAGFPSEKFLAPLESRQTPYIARVKNNAALDRLAEPYLVRPVGRPPREPRTWLHELSYGAKSWSRDRRVVLVVLERPDELFLHHFWLITNWTSAQVSAEELLEKYRQRGTAEGHMGELMTVLDPALSSSPRPKETYAGKTVKVHTPSGDAFAQNEVRFLLNALAYNVMHVLRTLLEEATGEGLSLSRLRERVLRVAARVLVHGRRAVLVITHASARLWELLWRRLRLLHAPPLLA